MLQQKSLKVATETVWPTNFKIFTIYSCIKSLLTLAITYWFWCIMSRNLEIVCTFNFKSCLAACSLVSKWKGLFEIFNWFLVKKMLYLFWGEILGSFLFMSMIIFLRCSMCMCKGVFSYIIHNHEIHLLVILCLQQPYNIFVHLICLQLRDFKSANMFPSIPTLLKLFLKSYH